MNKLSAKLKVAIVHDILIEPGGSERVLEELLKIFPQADLYTFYFNKANPEIRRTYAKYDPRSSLLSQIPGIYRLNKYFSITKLISWIYFVNLDLDKYDLVISSSHSYNSKMINKNTQALHVCYLYTPPRYLYEQQNELSFIKTAPWRWLFFPLLSLLRFLDKRAAEKPDVIITLSQEVKNRIWQYYRRKAQIIHPAVETQSYIPKKIAKKRYYVFHSRLVNQKGAQLAIKTCTRFGLPLKVIGEGYLQRQLQKIAGSTVEFLGYVDKGKLGEIYSHAKALIWCAIEEDFGIVPVEAMGYGVPVVAYRSGAVTETVIENKTGYFYDAFSPTALYGAILKLNRQPLKPRDCYQRAHDFGSKRFRNDLLNITQKIFRRKALIKIVLSEEKNNKKMTD